MGDLISRSELIKVLKDRATNEAIMGYMTAYDITNSIIDEVEEQPTTYSVNKVVEELEKAKHEIASVDYCRSINDKEKCDGRNCFECCAEYLIEIVKQGGVSDDVCEWIQRKGGVGLKEYKISCCDKTLEMPVSTARELKYCPYCGKKIKIVGD